MKAGDIKDSYSPNERIDLFRLCINNGSDYLHLNSFRGRCVRNICTFKTPDSEGKTAKPSLVDFQDPTEGNKTKTNNENVDIQAFLYVNLCRLPSTGLNEKIMFDNS